MSRRRFVMPPRRFLPTLAAGLLALGGAGLLAQSNPAPSSGAGSANSSAAARANAAASNPRPTPARTAATKGEIPDPNLFDGSDQPAEARPDKGMLAEFELPGSEQRPESMEAQSQSENPQQGGGGGEGPQGEQQGSGAGGTGEKPPGGASDPNAKAEGIAVAELKVDENSAAQQAAPPPKPREVSMGDQSMKIPVAVAQQSVIGSQQQAGAGQQSASNSQQYEKGAAAGKSSGNNQNKGLEKGRSIPEGL